MKRICINSFRVHSVNIAEGIVGSIDGYLQKNSGRIKKFLISMFDVTAERFTFVGNFMEAIGKISDVFKSDTAKQIGADIIAIFANPFTFRFFN